MEFLKSIKLKNQNPRKIKKKNTQKTWHMLMSNQLPMLALW